jgi:3-oxoacyl-(acyl-carrier-protein) synthase
VGVSNHFKAGQSNCEASSQQGARAALGACPTGDEASPTLSTTGVSQLRRIFVAGIGAVSPAGWNVAALRAALGQGEPLPIQSVVRPGWEKTLPARLVPNPAVRPEFLAHPRLRRSSPITHYAAAAALEAMAGLRANPDAKNFRIGIVMCLQTGCVQYSCRFYDETLKNPATASPLVFPETVYAAPTSHVAALLENVVLANSLVGDPSAFLRGVALGAQWLAENRVDACLVIGAEETNWIIADALRLLDRRAVVAGGAGALCLCRDPKFSMGVELSDITDAHTFSARQSRTQAAQAMRDQFGKNSSRELLCDGLGISVRTDAAECTAWRDWTGSRVSPKKILGEGLMAAAAWQCVAACDAVAENQFAAANVSLVGSNQQAIGARFVVAQASCL